MEDRRKRSTRELGLLDIFICHGREAVQESFASPCTNRRNRRKSKIRIPEVFGVRVNSIDFTDLGGSATQPERPTAQ
ncbi:hypothetical protein Nepgr_024657 [Nepenthes gracilis]|uniref:Uncharacterized protein n=1 Tax=Nepenthes gracilis TaxID=150966 RepID=A0AAD3Y088_NEPGR|nr:hypothetical protein Nepgr_024657 [Nepenthes gracilis]